MQISQVLSLLSAFAALLVLLVQRPLYKRLAKQLDDQQNAASRNVQDSINSMRQAIVEQQHKHQIEALQNMQSHFGHAITDLRQQLNERLSEQSERLNKSVQALTEQTDKRLKEISGQVDKRLADGFEKTTETFSNIIKRLALIDEAQKKITELSTNVVDLQKILSDKRSRGAFGEMQLTNLLRNMLPEQNFALQHTLSNGKRVDCMLFLPKPTGHIAIDAKFPLESYQLLADESTDKLVRQQASAQFRQDIKKHLNDIAEKYIISGETSDGAIMFIPAEAVFAEIHSHYPDLVELSHRLRVWLVSPTTLMAILTTARAVLKDAATRKQVHLIQEHIRFLAKDFQRFEKRMDQLAKHIGQAQQDVNDVNTSAKKLTQRFDKIEQVELGALEQQEG